VTVSDWPEDYRVTEAPSVMRVDMSLIDIPQSMAVKKAVMEDRQITRVAAAGEVVAGVLADHRLLRGGRPQHNPRISARLQPV
jgi:hypothetical protein